MHPTELSEAPCRGKKMTQNHKCRFLGAFRLFSRLNQNPDEEGLPRQETLVFAGYGLVGESKCRGKGWKGGDQDHLQWYFNK